MQLSDLTIYSSVIPAVCGLAVVRKITSPYRVFFIFCVVTVFTEFWALVLAGKQTNNLFIIHAHALMDCIIYTYLFSEFYEWSSLIKRIQYGGLVLFCVLSINYSMTGDHIKHFYSIPISIECIWICLWGGWVLNKLVQQEDFNLLRSDSLIVTGALIYFSVNFFIFTYYDYFISLTNKEIKLYDVHAVINIFTNIIFGAAFLCLKKPTR